MIRYEEPVFRPPSEAKSLIFQITLGCSYNRCTFCGMYKMKRFRIRPLEEVIEEIRWASKEYPFVRRVFLADGDPLCVPTDYMLRVLGELCKSFPRLERVGTYATPQNLLEKSPDELRDIREAGLKILYVGVESGSDRVLEFVKKGVNQRQIVEALVKAKEAGFTVSTTFILGLGGRDWWEEHALESAKVVNEAVPHYTAALTLMLIPKTVLHWQAQRGIFKVPTQRQIMKEMLLFVENIEVETVFRSNHVSNLIPIKANLPEDKLRLSNELAGYILMTPEEPLPSTWLGPF